MSKYKSRTHKKFGLVHLIISSRTFLILIFLVIASFGFFVVSQQKRALCQDISRKRVASVSDGQFEFGAW